MTTGQIDEFDAVLQRYWDHRGLKIDAAHISPRFDPPRRDGKPTATDYIHAMRVPETLDDQSAGLWVIRTGYPKTLEERLYTGGFRSIRMLRRATLATMMQGEEGWEVLMEDSLGELSKHLQIVMRARGRVLVTGLGLGCVVRGLLHNPDVEHIDVVEIDGHILRMVGPEFAGNPRITMHRGDALRIEWPPGTQWDYAWHDVWAEKNQASDLGTQGLHARLFVRYLDLVDRQGAWGFPRDILKRVKRQYGEKFL